VQSPADMCGVDLRHQGFMPVQPGSVLTLNKIRPGLTPPCNVQIKQRDEQIDSLQQQIMGLERTRDRCAPSMTSHATAGV